MITEPTTGLDEIFAEAASRARVGDDKAGWQARLAHREATEERHEAGIFPTPPGAGPAKMRYTHDAMIDMVVENPWIAQGDLARAFGYTEAWVSLIFSSDAFKERLEQRKAELIDPTIRASIDERLRAITIRSLEVLGAKLAKHPDLVPDNLALKAAELGAKGLGIGGNAAPNTQLPPNHLELLAQRLVQLQGASRRVNILEGEVIRVSEGV